MKIFIVLICMLFLVGCQPVNNAKASSKRFINDGMILYYDSNFIPSSAVEFRTSTGVLCVAVYGSGNGTGSHVTCNWGDGNE